MKKIIILSLLTFAVNAKYYGSATVSKVISIYDGGTSRASINNYPAIVGENIAIRVNGIDTPEIRGKCPSEKVLAIKVRDLAWLMLSNSKVVELHNISRGKYFRIVADVFIDGVTDVARNATTEKQ
jgi:endonuclease YncB( thermonuclease family)